MSGSVNLERLLWAENERLLPPFDRRSDRVRIASGMRAGLQ